MTFNTTLGKKALASFNHFKEYVNTRTDNFDYSKFIYNGMSKPSIIVCPTHGEFKQSASKHMMGRGCRKCQKFRTKTTAQFVEEAKQIHKDTYDYSLVVYKNCKEKIRINCKEHGVFEQTPDAHLNGKQGCPKCSNEKQGFTPEKYADKPAIFYVLKLKNGLYKPGITTQKSVKKRYNQDNFSEIVESIVFECSFIDGKEARLFEIDILNTLKNYKYKGKQVFPKVKNTEILTINPLPYVMQAFKLKD